MGRADYYLPGSWNAYCSMCGRKMKASMLVKNWQGFYRCPEHNEPRQPQDFVHGVVDKMTVPWAQTNGAGGSNFVPTGCTLSGKSAIVGDATFGCSIFGNTFTG